MKNEKLTFAILGSHWALLSEFFATFDDVTKITDVLTQKCRLFQISIIFVKIVDDEFAC